MVEFVGSVLVELVEVGLAVIEWLLVGLVLVWH